MPKNAPISVVIPCFNCAKTLGRALESVFAQTMLPSEIILVDDCSDDETESVIEAYVLSAAVLVVSVKHDVNSGAAVARNTGLDVAKFDYVAFLDSDDTWHPDKLSLQYHFMESHRDIHLSGHEIGYVGDVAPGHNDSVTGFRAISIRDLLLKNHLNTPSVMLRRSGYRFDPSLRYSEDLALWLDMAANGEAIAKLDQTLGYVHKPFYGAGGLSSSILKMEAGELRNFRWLYRKRTIGLSWFLIATFYSIVKFLRRLILVFLLRPSRFSTGSADTV
jgi:glycosyltransferase involved in cell wall biosynthesis